MSEKQAQAHLVRVVSGTSPACGTTHACRKSKHKHTLCTLYQARAQRAVISTLYQAQACGSTHACRKSKHQHTLCVCIRHKPSLRRHTCVLKKQAQAHLMHIVSGTSPACGTTQACRTSKHKHTLCTLYQAQAQPAVPHKRVGQASTSTPYAHCIRHKPSLQ